MAAWTQADLDALRAAVRSGVLTVRFDGPPARQVTYHNLSELRSLLAEAEASVADAAGQGARYRLASVRKGLGQ